MRYRIMEAIIENMNEIIMDELLSDYKSANSIDALGFMYVVDRVSEFGEDIGDLYLFSNIGSGILDSPIITIDKQSKFYNFLTDKGSGYYYMIDDRHIKDIIIYNKSYKMLHENEDEILVSYGVNFDILFNVKYTIDNTNNNLELIDTL